MKTLHLLLFCFILSIELNFAQTNTIETANDLDNKADTLFKYFKYDSASVYYCKAAAFYEQQQNWLPCVKNYRLTSNAFLKAGKYDSAEYFCEKAFDMADKQFQESNKAEMVEKSDVLITSADINEKKGKYKNELVSCKNALTHVFKTDSLDGLRIAHIWDKMGVAYTNLEKPDSALLFCNRALDSRIKLLGTEHIDVAESYSNIGKIYVKKGEFDKASDYYQKSLSIRIATLGEQHPDVALSYNNIGIIYTDKAQNDKALEYYQKSLSIRIATLGKQHPDVATSYNNIGIAYGDKGEYDKTLEYFQKALLIRIATLGEQHPYVAFSYYNIGILYNVLGQYDKALEYFEKSLLIRIAVFGKSHPDVADSYNNIGAAYYNKGEYDKALEYYLKALSIRTETLGKNHSYVANSYNYVGTVYNDKGEYNKALEYFQKALAIDIATIGERHQFVANIYNNIGLVYTNKEDYNKALEYYLKALSIRTSIQGEKHPEIALNYNKIGEIYSKTGEVRKALEYYQKALIANIVGFTDTSVYKNPGLENILSESVLLGSLAGKANTFYELYKNRTNSICDLETSLTTYTLAFQHINNMRNGYTIEDTKLLLSEKTKNYYALAVQEAMKLARLNPTQNNIDKSFEFIEKSKSATLSARFNEFNANLFGAIPDTLLAMEKELRSKISSVETEMLEEKSNKYGYDTVKVNFLENENFSSSRKLDSLISYFETTFPAYYRLKYENKIVSVPDIQKSLDSNSAILDYFVSDSILFIAIITDNFYELKEIPITQAFFKLISVYYNDIKTVETESFVSNSQLLYQKLLQPVQKYISHKKHLIILPDDYLYYVPFETLIDNTNLLGNSIEDYSTPGYLIKTHSVSYNHSATLWYYSIKSENIAAKQKLNFIGFAPVFDKENTTGSIISSKVNTSDTANNFLAYRSISSDMKRFNPLPYSKDEVTSIVRLFENRGDEAKAYINAAANEENFKDNSANYRIIHVSSHGFSNDKEPDLSGIVFSQPTDTLDKEDGILFAGETYNLNLNADLIVLSSCESGMGKLIKGEGLQALSRGFIYAGAPNVVFSLWKALDKPTKDLMVDFYSNVLNGKTYDESLREAKLSLIKNPATAFPHFWGGFVLVGR